MQPKAFEKEEKHALVRLLQTEVSFDGMRHVLLYALRLYCAAVFRTLLSGELEELRMIEYEL